MPSGIITEYAYPRCFEVRTIVCHSNCRKDKSDLILRPSVWEKIRAAGFAWWGDAS
jgi:hypothetical protein